jgi:hypothetical protein
LVLFGIGLLQYVQGRDAARRLGIIGASMFITMGLLQVASATVFPQDAWGSPPTFPGRMHIILHGVISLLSILYMLLIGIWFHRVKIFPGFLAYSLITIGLVIVSAGFFMANWGSPIMGLAERIPMLVGFQWTFILALWLFSRKGDAPAA